MSTMTTYITSSEMSLFYTDYSEHSAEIQAEALSSSYSLVNSFLNPEVKIPYVAPWDGVSQSIEGVPAILKIAQAQFCQYLCQFSNLGYTEELQSQYEATADMLRGIQEGELGIPGSSISEAQLGWTLASQTTASSSGYVHILNPGYYPYNYYQTVEVVIDSTTSGLQPYHGTFNPTTYATYKTRRPNISSSYQETGLKADNQWQTITDGGPTISFEGFFDEGDVFIFKGVPTNAQNVEEPAGSIVQRQLGR